MCKQHLNAFSIMTRSLECFGFRHLPRNATSLFVDATLKPAERRLGAALCLEQAVTTVARARKIQKRLSIVDRIARGPEDLACRADIYIALLVECKVVPTECSIFALRLIDHRDMRRDLLLVDKPVEICPRAVGRVCREPLGLDLEAFLCTLDHGLRRSNLCLADRA